MSATTPGSDTSEEQASYLTMPPERRAAAKAHAAMLSATMRRLVPEIAFQADVDDFRRVLIAEVE